MKMKYYSLNKIIQFNADYNIIIGERSNGKTYACLWYALEQYMKNGKQSAYIRRWREDITAKRAGSIYKSIDVPKATGGKFNYVVFRSGSLWLANYDENGKKYIYDKEPFMYVFALSNAEHDKSTSFPNVTTVIFDEFITRQYYLKDEFILYMNTLSTIIRDRTGVKIFMLGNTVNKFCPYFSEMGLKHVTEMEQGSIDLYKLDSLKIAVEYCAPTGKAKKSNKYFSFDNSKLEMIKGGAWELDVYPHLSIKYTQRDILFTYFIRFDDQVLQCEIIAKDNNVFTYIHAKTTPIKDENKDVIYQVDPSPKPNIKNNLLQHTNKLETIIASYFVRKKVFYQSNEIGEVVSNFIKETNKRVV